MLGWFDSNDQLISPPNDKELPDIVAATTSEAETITVMDLNTVMALFETADDLEVLRGHPKSHLIRLCLQVINSSTQESLKKLSKSLLIDKLRDAVRHNPHWRLIFH